jgi:glucose dehydrogenase
MLVSLGGYLFSAQSTGTTEAKGAASPLTNTEWRLLGGNSDQSQHSALNQVNDKNVDRLGLAWVAEIPRIRCRPHPLARVASAPKGR